MKVTIENYNKFLGFLDSMSKAIESFSINESKVRQAAPNGAGIITFEFPEDIFPEKLTCNLNNIKKRLDLLKSYASSPDKEIEIVMMDDNTKMYIKDSISDIELSMQSAAAAAAAKGGYMSDDVFKTSIEDLINNQSVSTSLNIGELVVDRMMNYIKSFSDFLLKFECDSNGNFSICSEASNRVERSKIKNVAVAADDSFKNKILRFQAAIFSIPIDINSMTLYMFKTKPDDKLEENEKVAFRGSMLKVDAVVSEIPVTFYISGFITQ